jgi:hypothetical protein
MTAFFPVVLFLILCFFVFTRTDRIAIDPYTVFFLSSITYMFYIPLAMIVIDDYRIPTIEISLDLSQRDWDHVVLLSGLALVSSSLVFQAVTSLTVWPPLREPLRRIDLQQAYHFNADTKKLAATSAVFVTALVVMHYDKLAGAVEGYEVAYTIAYENSLYSFQLFTAFMSLFVLAGHLILTQRRYILVFAASSCLFILFALLLYSKTYLLLIILNGLCLLYRLGLRRKLSFLLIVMTGMVLAFLLIFPAYSYYRGSGTLDLSFLTDGNTNAFFSDAPGPFAAITYIVQNSGWYAFVSGVTTAPLWTSFVLWVPRALWPTRPLDITEAFARFVLDDWREGQGIGFSPLAEGVLRFGDPGSMIIPGLIGGVAALMLAFFLSFYPRSLRPALMTSIGGFVLFYSQRGPLSQTVSLMLHFFVPHTLVFSGIDLGTRLWRYVAAKQITPALEKART